MRSHRVVTPRRLLLVAVVLATIAGIGGLGWVWRHPHTFDAYQSGLMMGHDAWPQDTPAYVGVALPAKRSPATLTIRSAKARVASDTAGTTAEVLICTVSDGSGGPGFVGPKRIGNTCGKLVPAEGATLDLNAKPRQQLVLALILHQVGRVEVQGVDVAYTDGWRTGSQRVGGDVIIRSPKTRAIRF